MKLSEVVLKPVKKANCATVLGTRVLRAPACNVSFVFYALSCASTYTCYDTNVFAEGARDLHV